MKNILKIISFIIICTFYTAASDKEKQQNKLGFPITISKEISPEINNDVLCFIIYTRNSHKKIKYYTNFDFKEKYTQSEADQILDKTFVPICYHRSIFTALTQKRPDIFEFYPDLLEIPHKTDSPEK